MHRDTLKILRCPFCGGRLELVDSLFHREVDSALVDGIIACECCTFPVVDGIPVMHLQANAAAARDAIEAGQPALARRSMLGIEHDDAAARFETAAADPDATYRDIVEALGAGAEGRYFVYRFSDPTFIVAEAVVRSVAGTVLSSGGRAIDVCGGSGHLTRTLGALSPAPVLADLYFAKIWMARRFTARQCEPVCCDGNGALPFARGAFAYAMCSDAFMFIWTKRPFIGEMCRLVDGPGGSGTVVIAHTHNQLVWSPSHGNPLTPAGYRELFETRAVRGFAEAGLFRDLVDTGSIDLARLDTAAALDRDPALTFVASDDDRVFTRHEVPPPIVGDGQFRINPLYDVVHDNQRARLRLRLPDADYEYEYGTCREYLPDETTIELSALTRLERGEMADDLRELLRRRVILHLPRYY